MRARLDQLSDQKRRGGFTIVELLLTVVLISLLAGAIIFSITSPGKNTELDGGTERFETLLRFARAHAASTGRKVKIVFEENGSETTENSSRIVLLWEPDPLGRPGVFEPVPGQSWADLTPDGSIAVESARLVNGSAPGSDPGFSFSDESELAASAPPPITFFPDGSSDSVEVVISSRHPDDARKFSVRLAGLTGSIRRQLVIE
jgi:prepilin-type N-terminal cleavage/methylation domain-containing protein